MSGYTIEITETKNIEVTKLVVEAGVRYWEDGEINGHDDVDGNMPCREDDCWCPVIDLKSGIIQGWPSGVVANIHYKVCDAGVYSLFNDEGDEVKSIEGYVPKIMCPKENGYGDYIIMDIDGSGKIADWKVVLQEWEESQ